MRLNRRIVVGTVLVMAVAGCDPRPPRPKTDTAPAVPTVPGAPGDATAARGERVPAPTSAGAAPGGRMP